MHHAQNNELPGNIAIMPQTEPSPWVHRHRPSTDYLLCHPAPAPGHPGWGPVPGMLGARHPTDAPLGLMHAMALNEHKAPTRHVERENERAQKQKIRDQRHRHYQYLQETGNGTRAEEVREVRGHIGVPQSAPNYKASEADDQRARKQKIRERRSRHYQCLHENGSAAHREHGDPQDVSQEKDSPGIVNNISEALTRQAGLSLRPTLILTLAIIADAQPRGPVGVSMWSVRVLK